MICYALKIGNKFFKDYKYAEKNMRGRINGTLCENEGRFQEGDIIDLVLTEKPKRTETKRSIGNTIALIYRIEKFKKSEIIIVPIEE